MAKDNDPLLTVQKPDYVRSRLKEIGFWFVDIPRTSTTTLKLAFYKKYGKLFGKPSASQGIGMGLIPHHLPARLVRDQVGTDLWDSLYTFTLVRNPFDRALSLFLFLQQNGKLKGWSFSRYIDQLVKPGGFEYHGHYLGSCAYIQDLKGQDLVTEVFRFEDRQQAMQEIAKRTSCPELARDEKHAYGTDHRHYSEYYDAASRRKIEVFYGQDLERFSYKFEKA